MQYKTLKFKPATNKNVRRIKIIKQLLKTYYNEKNNKI